MKKEEITVIEGEGDIRTILSLQFVYKGSTVHKEYGCFLSSSKTLEEIGVTMNHHGMFSDCLKECPSIIMFDVYNLRKINSQTSGGTLQLETLFPLIKSIYHDVRFTRLAIDGFDLLCTNDTRKTIEEFFDFARANEIKVLFTVDLNYENPDLLEMCDNYITIKRGYLPVFFFS